MSILIVCFSPWSLFNSQRTVHDTSVGSGIGTRIKVHCTHLWVNIM